MHEKHTRFEAAPAASVAGDVGPRMRCGYSARVKARHFVKRRFSAAARRKLPLYERPRIDRAEYNSGEFYTFARKKSANC